MYENALSHVSSDNNDVHLSLVYARMSPGHSLVYERTDVLSFDIDFIRPCCWLEVTGRYWTCCRVLELTSRNTSSHRLNLPVEYMDEEGEHSQGPNEYKKCHSRRCRRVHFRVHTFSYCAVIILKLEVQLILPSFRIEK